MTSAANDCRVDYVEFTVSSISKAKSFYNSVFGWSFTDWGDAYTSFDDGRLGGGFRLEPHIETGGPLVVMYAINLEAVRERVLGAGGTIVRDTFSFPGGRRFQFLDPFGHELGVWSDQSPTGED